MGETSPAHEKKCVLIRPFALKNVSKCLKCPNLEPSSPARFLFENFRCATELLIFVEYSKKDHRFRVHFIERFWLVCKIIKCMSSHGFTFIRLAYLEDYKHFEWNFKSIFTSSMSECGVLNFAILCQLFYSRDKFENISPLFFPIVK